MYEEICNLIKRIIWYIKSGAEWILIGLFVGCICGIVGTAFALGINYATSYRMNHGFILYFLPLAGPVIVWIYHRLDVAGRGTNDIIAAAREGNFLPVLLIPAIFVSTIITHLFGGSAGREGAALQIGGDIGNTIGKCFKLEKRKVGMITRVGMSSFFAALFGTPVAATAFGTMVINVGEIPYLTIFPALIASLVSSSISYHCGVAPVRFNVGVPSLDSIMIIKIAILAMLCAIVSVLFVKSLSFFNYLMRKYLKNAYVRALVGGCIIVLLSLLLNTRDYNGAGMDVISKALLKGEASPVAFIWKILFTAITLEAGYKGGEVVPTFFNGATFGCFASTLLQIPPQFGAAIGMIGVFGAATNSFLSPLFLSVEVFSGTGIIFFALACIICYIYSGYSGLYSSQMIVFSKVTSEQVDAKTNLYHTGDWYKYQ